MFAFAEGAGDQVKEVGIDAGDGCVAPTHDTIADGSYPLSRSLFIYLERWRLPGDEADVQGLRGLLPHGRRAHDSPWRKTKYIALPADRQEATRSAWELAVS